MISPLYGQLSPLRIPTRAPRGPVTDSDALAYIAAVETADGQALEDAVKFAYEDFILGCKSDGIWSALKASCILAGARTLSGALVPLVGPAPININFVSGDYDRKTGLLGNGSTKRLSTINNNTLNQNDNHLYARVSAPDLRGVTAGLLGTSLNTTGSSGLGRFSTSLNFRSMCQSASLVGGTSWINGNGVSRGSSAQFTRFANDVTAVASIASQIPRDEIISVFSAGTSFTNSKICYYSVGNSLNLSVLNYIVARLMTDLAAAIP